LGNWVSGRGLDMLPDPLVKLCPQFSARQEGEGDAMEIHRFANKNRDLLDKWAQYLQEHSGDE